MSRLPPMSSRTATPFPSATLFRSRFDFLALVHHRPHGAELVERVKLLAEGVFRIAVFFGGDDIIGCLDHAGNRRVLREPLLLHQQFERAEPPRSEEHTSELQSLMRISYAVFCLKKKHQLCTHLTHTHKRSPQ